MMNTHTGRGIELTVNQTSPSLLRRNAADWPAGSCSSAEQENPFLPKKRSLLHLMEPFISYFNTSL